MLTNVRVNMCGFENDSFDAIATDAFVPGDLDAAVIDDQV
jgi:hypothetical protein